MNSFVEWAALVAKSHADDRPRRDSWEWNDGYQDGCRGAAQAILDDEKLKALEQVRNDLQTAVNQLYEELRLALECNPNEGWSERASVVLNANVEHVAG